jgi:hypothetical protein
MCFSSLEALKEPCRVKLHSDSLYLIKPLVEGKAQRWQLNDWVRSRVAMKPVKNADLWQRLLDAAARHEVEYIWVRGHAGIVENERCDAISVQAAQSGNLPIDPGFTPKPSNALIANKQAVADLAGRICRKCATPLIRKSPRAKHRPGQTYYFEYYLLCPQCRTMYMVEAAKRTISPPP